MADFLPQTVLNVNYGRQGRAVFQLTTPLHFVCRRVVQNTCTQSRFVKHDREGFSIDFASRSLLLVWEVLVLWGCVCEWGKLIFSLFSRDQSWFNENLPFHQRTLQHGDYQNLLGKVHSAINSLARTEFTEMWKGVWVHKEDVTVMWIL